MQSDTSSFDFECNTEEVKCLGLKLNAFDCKMFLYLAILAISLAKEVAAGLS